MPSYRTKQRLKRLKQGLVIPNLQKDLKEIRSGRPSYKTPKEERVNKFVQARGM